MTIFSLVSLSAWTSERTSLYICRQLFLSFSYLLLNESFLQCVLLWHFGQEATSPETSIPYTAQEAHNFSFICYLLRYLHGLLCKHLILPGLTTVKIQQIVSSQGDHFNDEGHSLTIPSYGSCACPVIGCTFQKKQSTMAVETNAVRGPLNSVLNSARPTVCIKPLSECFDEWQLPEGINRKMSGKLQCKTSPKQLTCKRVVKKYANMKKSPSTEFKRKLFLYADSPRHPSPPPPSEPTPPLPTNPADNGPNTMLKEKLLNGQTSENGSSEVRGNECDANGTSPKDTAECVTTPNGKSLQAACNLVRRKYLKYWRKSLECTTAAGGERRFLKNVRLCDVFKPGSDKCLHAQLPQNVIIPSHSPRQHIGSGTDTHSENMPCSIPQQRTSGVSRWNVEDKNIFALLNHTSSVKSQCANTSVRDETKVDKNTRIKADLEAPSSNKHPSQQTSANAKETLSNDALLKNTESHDNQKLSSSLSSSSSPRSHTNSLNCIRKSSSHHCCVEISDQSLNRLQHADDPCKSSIDNGPLQNPCEKLSHQTCFSEDSAFSSGSSSSSGSGSGIDSQEHVTKLPKVQRTRRKNGRQAPYSYNYFTNSEQEGPRIRRRRMCPCCMSSSPVKKRRRRSPCRSDLPGDYQRFVQSTLQLNSLRNKLHLFLTVLFPKLYPFLDSISAESENIDLILNEAVSLVQNGKLVTSTGEPTSEHSSSLSSSSTAANSENNKNDNSDINKTGSNNNNSSSSSSCSMEEDETIRSGSPLLNVKVNVCRSPEQCLSRLTEKTLILLSSLLPGLSFKEEYFYDMSSGHLEYLIDLVVRSNQSVPLSDVNL